MTPRHLQVLGLIVGLLLSRGALSQVSSREAAAIDLTGFWVSVISEDWLYRMVTPARGDYSSVPLNELGVSTAETWDPEAGTAAGVSCMSYGPPGLIRQPGRLRIDWQDDETLRIDFDAGMQTRLLRFGVEAPEAAEPHTHQGYSRAEWQRQDRSRALFGTRTNVNASEPGQGGTLGVITTHMNAGFLRTNGVPYSESTQLEEYFDVITVPNDTEWLIVTTIVRDPTYLAQPFVISTNFKREPDDSGWMSRPCTAP